MALNCFVGFLQKSNGSKWHGESTTREKKSITELHSSSGMQKKPEATGSNTTQLRLVLVKEVKEHFQAQS